jgi:hypothetical protein
VLKCFEKVEISPVRFRSSGYKTVCLRVEVQVDRPERGDTQGRKRRPSVEPSSEFRNSLERCRCRNLDALDNFCWIFKICQSRNACRSTKFDGGKDCSFVQGQRSRAQSRYSARVLAASEKAEKSERIDIAQGADRGPHPRQWFEHKARMLLPLRATRECSTLDAAPARTQLTLTDFPRSLAAAYSKPPCRRNRSGAVEMS